MTAPTYREREELMDADRLARTLSRMAHEILERHPDIAGTVLVGVRTRGVPLARRLAELLREATGLAPLVGALDITLYRDDLTTVGPQPVLKGTDIPASIDGRTVILVDDVLYTGRTARAALDELIDFGRPSRIELAVLVDRGHRELPIHADYAGRTLTTSRDEAVQVTLREEDGHDRVVLQERVAAPGARPRPPRGTPARKRPARPAAKARAGGRRR
ncbi:MAG TPA: bifunctional pyr operon transcriptional regulator/uracil phosphoribosyltransferase PyrR [Vicinamibacteria bacterium]|nr:bifunctional pyr operon transcriptional regulator/uracil phosphoribosyltransferase PyrR [Vicinamibacteria bacterium]